MDRLAELRGRRVTAVARYLGVDEDLEAGALTLVGGGAMLGDAIVLGGVLIAGGAAIIALSERRDRMRGAVA